MEGEKIRSNSRTYGSTQSKTTTDRIVYIEHSVLPNETIASISVKYDVPIHNIRRANRLLMNDALYDNMKIYIPTKLNPATITVTEINGEPLVVGDNHAPVQKSQNKLTNCSQYDSSFTQLESSQDSLVASQSSVINETMKRQQSVHDIFDKIDQTVTAVKGSMSTLKKDGFYASQCSNSSEELFGAPKTSIYTEDTSSIRSNDSRSSTKNNLSGMCKVDSYGHRMSGLSSTALQLANDHDNTDFPL